MADVDPAFRITHPAILDPDVAGSGLERRVLGAVEALRFLLRHFTARLFLWAPHHGRHSGSWARDHAGNGCRVGYHLPDGSFYGQDLHQRVFLIMSEQGNIGPGNGNASLLRFEKVS